MGQLGIGPVAQVVRENIQNNHMDTQNDQNNQMYHKEEKWLQKMQNNHKDTVALMYDVRGGFYMLLPRDQFGLKIVHV